MSNAPEVTARTVHAADLACGGNRVCRVGIECGPDGPEALTLMMGWHAGPEYREDRTASSGEGLTLPAEKIAPLRCALAALIAAVSK